MPLCLRVGHIPEELSNLAKLEKLDVGANDLTGVIRQNNYVMAAPPSRLLAIARPYLRRFVSLSLPPTFRPAHTDTRRFCKILLVFLKEAVIRPFMLEYRRGGGGNAG